MVDIDIVIATYGPNGQRFLDDCLLSIQKQTHKEKQVYVISSGDFKPQINCSMDVIHKHYLRRMHFPEAVNEGVKAGSSEHILLCNNDIIMQKDCIETMLKNMKDRSIINPISTCSNGRFYNIPLAFKMRDFAIAFESNQYKYEDVAHYKNEIIESMGSYPGASAGWFPIQFCAFFCTLMKRSTWDEVGGIDIILKTGQDDFDFCLRAKQKGIDSIVSLNSFCFHYSGITANEHLTKEDRQFNVNHFNEKWKNHGISLPNIK